MDRELSDVDAHQVRGLDQEQEQRLARVVEAGIYAQWLLESKDGREGLEQVVHDGMRAWHALWLANTGLVVTLARRFGRGRREVEEDLVQEGWIALAEALMSFDWARETRLSTHVWRRVQFRLTDVMRERTHWERRTAMLDEELPVAHSEREREGPVVRELLDGMPALERAVLELRAQGTPLKQAARQLGMGPASVRSLERRAVARARDKHHRAA